MELRFGELMRNLDRLTDNKGFTLVEVIVASILVAFVAAGVWGVYWSVVNTYYVEQRGVNLQTEGERILDLIANGGWYKDKRIYGLNSAIPHSSYPNVGEVTSINFDDKDDQQDQDMCHIPATWVNRDDYRIEFILDNVSGNTRYAEFAAQLFTCDPDGAGPLGPVDYATGILWFRLKDTSGDPAHNYEVEITNKLLSRTTSEDFQDYQFTWFKAQLLPKDPSPSSNYYSGIKVSFYLVDYPTEYDAVMAEGMYHTIKYNKRLQREVDPPISDPDQRRSFLGGIPYPKYFSTTVYFPNRE